MDKIQAKMLDTIHAFPECLLIHDSRTQTCDKISSSVGIDNAPYWRDEEVMVAAKNMRAILIEYERSMEELYT